MSTNYNINVHHVTRIEGHGNIVVDVKNGAIKQLQWQVPESPRFFEAMVKGHPWRKVHTITSRICGICSIGHTLASVKATEDAFGVKISPIVGKIRRLQMHAENMQSHVLHAGYLVVPDLAGAKSVVPLVATHKDAVLTVVRLHRIANDFSDVVCGRTTHPITIIPGGLTMYPNKKDLEAYAKKLEGAVPDLKAVVALYKALLPKFPKFDRDTEYIGLVADDEYAFYDGKIGSTDLPKPVDVHEYRKVTNEFLVPQSTAKYTKNKRDSYMVGALARYKLNYGKLHPIAREVAAALELTPKCVNPFFNTVAQVVETAHMVEDTLKMIPEVLDDPYKKEDVCVKVTPKAATGVGSTDVPRGILFHEYTYDKDGICQGGNIIIPTNENHNNIQKDFEKLVPEFMGKWSEDEMRLGLEMLVRAYDPCVSCSTHMLNVEFVK